MWNFSLFLIAKISQLAFEDIHSLKVLQPGVLMMAVSSANQTNLLSNCTTTGSFSVSVSGTSNSKCKPWYNAESRYFIIYKWEIFIKFKCHIDVGKCFLRCTSADLHSLTLPTRIKADYLSCPVRPFIPKRIGSFNYQHYIHSKTARHGSKIYDRWAVVSHDNKFYQNEELFANCKGNHSAFSRCPRCLFEK